MTGVVCPVMDTDEDDAAIHTLALLVFLLTQEPVRPTWLLLTWQQQLPY